MQPLYITFPVVLFLLGFAFLMQKSVCLHGIDLHHDLLMYDAARQFLNGATPFKDFFYQYNIATLIVHKLSLQLIGDYISSLKIITAIAYAAIAASIYILTVFFRAQGFGLMLALAWSCLSPFYMPAMNGYHPWSTVYMMASVMIGLNFALFAAKNNSLKCYFFSGVMFSLAFWFKQVAAIHILLILVWFMALYFTKPSAKKSLIPLFLFSVGGWLVSALFLLYLYLSDALHDWYLDAFVFNGIFASTSQSGSSFFLFLKNLLPITKDLGYVSVFWAMLPVCVLTIVAIKVHSLKKSYLAEKTQNEMLLLVLLMGLAGWICYFPLSHAFHTQLFMAPLFVVLAVVIFEKKYNDTNNEKYMIWFLLAVLSYELLAHGYGFYRKNTLPTIKIIETPAKGIALSKNDYLRFSKFSSTLNVLAEEHAFLPMSGDPIRALLPLENQEKLSKMGVNWSWPNELVEPGFIEKLTTKVAKKNDYIYADNLIAIPGYHVQSIIEMRSPLTNIHSLYVPSSSVKNLSDVYLDSNLISDIACTSKLLSFSTIHDDFNVALPKKYQFYRIPYSLRLDSIRDISVSILPDIDIPTRLNSYEFNLFIEKYSKTGFYPDISKFFSQNSNGAFTLRKISEKEKMKLGKFFLMTGKLLDNHKSPIYATTLSSSIANQPVLAIIHNDKPKLNWAKFCSVSSGLAVSNNSTVGVPIGQDSFGPRTVYIQITYEDSTSIDGFMRVD